MPRYYGADLAAFVMAIGESAAIWEDADGTPVATEREGRVVILPTPVGTEDDPLLAVKVFDAPGGTQLVDLVDHNGASVSEIPIPDDWSDLGQLLKFGVNGGPDGDVWVALDAELGPWFRAMPFSDELFARLIAVEQRSLTGMLVGSPSDGNVPVYNGTTAKWSPGLPGTGTIKKINTKSPDGNGLVTLTAADVGAGSAANVAALMATSLSMIQQAGDGYASHPVGVEWRGFLGTVNPGPGLKKFWFRPKTGSVA